MRFPRLARSLLLALVATALVTACDGGGPMIRFMVRTPHEEYAARLREVGLHTTALGREWLRAAERALAEPLDVDVPHREARFLDPAAAPAVAYRVSLERGQRLVVQLEVPDAKPWDFRFFVDLFLIPDSAARPLLVASADSAGWRMEYVALRPGVYVLRVQPELLRGGRLTMTLSARASLTFPVVGRSMDAIRSRFGEARDAGRREHHGVDIFAPRGTPVVAAAAGRVSRVSTSRLGGNVVWLRESGPGRSLYYAHLDRHAVEEDSWVEPGDTLGFVGNTGNARTTPPHLHFGIYLRGFGPVDPHFHIYDPPTQPPLFAGDTGAVGRWVGIARPGALIRPRPSTAGATLSRLAAGTPVEVLAGTGEWYLARLPDGQAGYVSVGDTRLLERADSATVSLPAVLRTAPTTASAEIDSLPQGQLVPVLGGYGEYVLVRHPSGPHGWIRRESLANRLVAAPAPATGASSSDGLDGGGR